MQLIVRSINSGSSELLRKASFIGDSIAAPWNRRTVQGRAQVIQTRVLLVDDVSSVLTTVAALLRESFDVIDMVSDGRSALEAALKLRPDLVVLDISMPGMSGIEVAKELRRGPNPIDVKIVFLTVHEDSDILATCLAAGGLGYVLKILMDSDLVPAIKEALAGRIFISRLSSVQNTPC
jgi:DNA-binding NarL/FixJ family response regulator